MPSNLKPTTVI